MPVVRVGLLHGACIVVDDSPVLLAQATYGKADQGCTAPTRYASAPCRPRRSAVLTGPLRDSPLPLPLPGPLTAAWVPPAPLDKLAAHHSQHGG